MGVTPYHTRRDVRYAEAPGYLDNADIRDAVRRSPFRTAIAPWPCAAQDIPPPAAFMVLVAGEAVTPAALRGAADDVERAHAVGASALILADDKAQRDSFRDALVQLLDKRRAARGAVVVGRA